MPSDETVLLRESPERNAVVLACSVVLGWARVGSGLVVAGLSAVVYASIVRVWEPC